MHWRACSSQDRSIPPAVIDCITIRKSGTTAVTAVVARTAAYCSREVKPSHDRRRARKLNRELGVRPADVNIRRNTIRCARLPFSAFVGDEHNERVLAFAHVAVGSLLGGCVITIRKVQRHPRITACNLRFPGNPHMAVGEMQQDGIRRIIAFGDNRQRCRQLRVVNRHQTRVVVNCADLQ